MTGGAKTHIASRWFAYLEERSRHLHILEEEFLYNDERCKQKMVQLRMSQRTLARAADRLLLEGNDPDQNGQRRPVIIGYGNGRGNGYAGPCPVHLASVAGIGGGHIATNGVRTDDRRGYERGVSKHL